MGFLDKAKQQAQDIKGKVEGKVDDVQSKRKSTELLSHLGRYAYAERTDRLPAGAEAEITRLVGELRSAEQDGASVLPELETTPPASSDGPAGP